MAEHDLFMGAGEAVVARLGEHVGLGVGVVAGVEVRPADPAAGDLEQHLTLVGFGLGQVDDVEVAVMAGDGPHDGSRLSSKAGSGLM